MSGSVIDISYEQQRFRTVAPDSVVRMRLETILAELGVPDTELSVSFVSDASMQELNRTYRDRDEPTDILSFVQMEDEEDVPWPNGGVDGTHRVLGDLVISPDALQRNAQSFTVSTDEELYRLLIHGILHLLGEDHATNDANEPMLVHQEELLSRLGGARR